MIKYLLCFCAIILLGCNGEQTGRLEKREAHFLVHERMERDLQELMRRHSNRKHEHDKWVTSQRDTLSNEALHEIEQSHEEMAERHAAIIAEHHALMEQHRTFFELKDDTDIPQDEWRARYKEIESEHERMEKEHKQMKLEHEQMKAEHSNFDAKSGDAVK